MVNGGGLIQICFTVYIRRYCGGGAIELIISDKWEGRFLIIVTPIVTSMHHVNNAL